MTLKNRVSLEMTCGKEIWGYSSSYLSKYFGRSCPQISLLPSPHLFSMKDHKLISTSHHQSRDQTSRVSPQSSVSKKEIQSLKPLKWDEMKWKWKWNEMKWKWERKEKKKKKRKKKKGRKEKKIYLISVSDLSDLSTDQDAEVDEDGPGNALHCKWILFTWFSNWNKSIK